MVVHRMLCTFNGSFSLSILFLPTHVQQIEYIIICSQIVAQKHVCLIVAHLEAVSSKWVFKRRFYYTHFIFSHFIPSTWNESDWNHDLFTTWGFHALHSPIFQQHPFSKLILFCWFLQSTMCNFGVQSEADDFIRHFFYYHIHLRHSCTS